MIGIGVIGYGYWGPNLVRNFSEAAGAQVRFVSDRSEKRLELVRRRYPSIRTETDANTVIDSPEVQAVVIATPTSSHFELAYRALQAGKHVLVEKPIASSAEEAKKLIAEAERRKLTLMVDHTFIYTPAVRRIREMIAKGDIGDVLYYDSTRINLGLFQHDVDVIWDLGVHDLSILHFILGQTPQTVSAVGKSHLAGHPENVAYITLNFANGTIAHINVNWLSPVKIRRTIIGGTKKMIVYDDLEPSEKIKIYDKGVDVVSDPEVVKQMLVGYRTGDMWAPQLPNEEALGKVASHFISCINEGKISDTSGAMGLGVVEVLEAAGQSMRLNGQAVRVGS